MKKLVELLLDDQSGEDEFVFSVCCNIYIMVLCGIRCKI